MVEGADGIMAAWVKEAECEFREKGWKNASQNAVLMTVFAELSCRLNAKMDKVLKPLWVMAASVATAVLWLVIRQAILGV